MSEHYGAYRLNRRELMLYLTASGAVLFCTGFLFFRSLPAAVLLSLLAWPMKVHCEEHFARRRKEQFSREFRDLLYALSASVSAGRQMVEALKEGMESLVLIYGENSLMVKKLRQMIQRTAESRESEEGLLLDLARRSGHPDVRQLAEVYSVCRRTGGDLEKAIGKTSAVLLDRIAIRAQVQLLTAQKRLEASILTAIPFLLVLLLNLFSPAYLQNLYGNTVGRLMMAGCLLAIYTAWKWSMKLTDIAL